YVAGAGFCCDDASPQLKSIPTTGDAYEKLQYYYHPDHLGSASYITNLDGEVVQHIEYVPFGEVFLEERNNTWNTPYLFNGKELDEETGLYYYGARYYNPRASQFLSTDRFAEKYPYASPYQYCLNNPINAIDVNGDSISIVFNSVVTAPNGNSSIKTDSYHYGQDNNGNYSFLDASGNSYSGNDPFVSQVSAALGKLRQGRAGRKLVDELVNSSNNTQIVSRNYNSADVSGGQYVTWNPTLTTGGPDINGNTNRDPFVSLVHELAHVQDVWNGTIDRSTWFRNGKDNILNAEKYATHIENQIRSEHNISLRASYAVGANGGIHSNSRIINGNRESLFFNTTRTIDYSMPPILGATPPSPPMIMTITEPFKY
ncbi:MAG: RHS repeat-associated core domain-containing protein, partial [Bacteroidales bacterium]